MITIEGYSGCGIRVFRNPEQPRRFEYILEKSTDSPSYVPRLILQQQKQASFAAFNKLPYVVVPRILYMRQDSKTEFDHENGLPLPPKPLTCAVGMNFVHHTDAISFLSKATTAQVREFGLTLIGVLQQYVDASPVQPVRSSIFTEKLADIRRIVGKNPHVAARDRDFVCDVVIPSLSHWLIPPTVVTSEAVNTFNMMLPVGLCHGDLTLSNILIASQDDDESRLLVGGGGGAGGSGSSSSGVVATKIILIDFLDSFIETPLADMAKLCQDLKYAWTIRVSNSSQSLDTVHFFMILEYLRKQMESVFAHHQWYQKYFTLMFVMNQLRVLQYSKNSAAAAYLAGTVREEFELWRSQQARSMENDL